MALIISDFKCEAYCLMSFCFCSFRSHVCVCMWGMCVGFVYVSTRAGFWVRVKRRNTHLKSETMYTKGWCDQICMVQGIKRLQLGMLCYDSKIMHPFMWILMKMISGWFFNLHFRIWSFNQVCSDQKRWCTGGELLTRQCNLGEKKVPETKHAVAISNVLLLYTVWWGGK